MAHLYMNTYVLTVNADAFKQNTDQTDRLFLMFPLHRYKHNACVCDPCHMYHRSDMVNSNKDQVL